ncbi:MAG TPA: CoA transferase [Candidatus Binataceae bacterium]|nr:CoA transferase [Candidatus Binataceae bacterium]
MARKRLVPEDFGPLSDVRVISAGNFIAEPFAAQLAAEMGAEVIHIEAPGTGDATWRSFGNKLPARDGGAPVGTNWIQERRNMFSVSLDISSTRGRDMLLGLARDADLLMESSKPGTWQRWGLDDEAFWKLNRRLVITHVSGYGHYGDPDWIGRASYDSIAQAFGGTMYQTGFADPMPPTRAQPYLGDYTSAYMVLWSSLAALLHARATGEGQAIDLALFEALHLTLGGTMIDYFQRGIVRERSGNKGVEVQPLDTFRARDGWVMLAAAGGAYERLLKAIGLDPADRRWKKAHVELDSPEGVEFDRYLRRWIAERSADEVVQRLSAEAKVPCGVIMSSREMAENPHYRARGLHVEWEDEQVGPVKGIGFAPRFSRTPGKIWRGSVRLGHDNARIYGELLALSPAELEQLRRDGVI